MKQQEIKKLISIDAKEAVDLLFETGCINPILKRKQLDAYEEYLKKLITLRVESGVSSAYDSAKNKIIETLN